MEVNQVNLNGEELINLTNDTVSEETLLYGATAHNAAGEKITGMARYINPNLLINSDFSINQVEMAQTLYNANEYFCDGWFVNSSDVEIILTGTGGGKFTNKGSVLRYIVQRLEDAPMVDDVTLSVSIDGTIYSQSLIVPRETGSSEALKVEGVNIYLYNSGSYVQLSFGINAGASVFVDWVKLEPGKIATPYMKPDRALELTRCQRLSLVIRGITRYSSATAVGSTIDFLIPLPTSMRTMPSLVASNLIVKTTANVEVEGFTFAIVAHRANYVNVRATKTAHGLTAALLEIPSGTYLKFDANI